MDLIFWVLHKFARSMPALIFKQKVQIKYWPKNYLLLFEFSLASLYLYSVPQQFI